MLIKPTLGSISSKLEWLSPKKQMTENASEDVGGGRHIHVVCVGGALFLVTQTSVATVKINMEVPQKPEKKVTM